MNLYDLAHAYQGIQALANNEDVDAEAMQMALAELGTEIESKTLNIAIIIKGLESDTDIIKAEERRLADRRKALENKAGWLKQYAKEQLEAAGIDKVKSPTLTVAIQNNPPAVQITDPDIIPARFQTIVPETYTIDKKAVGDALKAGEDVPGAELTQGRSLRIR